MQQQPLNKVWRILKKHGDSMKCQSSSSDRRSSGVEGLLERESRADCVGNKKKREKWPNKEVDFTRRQRRKKRVFQGIVPPITSRPIFVEKRGGKEMQDYKSSRLFDLFGNWRVS